MNYKGKLIDTATAPITVTGKTVEQSMQNDYTQTDTVRDNVDRFTRESDRKR